jgi:hypothetical protein
MTQSTKSYLPSDSEARKGIPLTTGLLDYAPAALAEIAKMSRIGNLKHCEPGEPLQHKRGVSADHADCIARHLIDRGTTYIETLKDGSTVSVRHSAALAWRAIMLLQEELEAEGATMARAATPATPATPQPEPPKLPYWVGSCNKNGRIVMYQPAQGNAYHWLHHADDGLADALDAIQAGCKAMVGFPDWSHGMKLSNGYNEYTMDYMFHRRDRGPCVVYTNGSFDLISRVFRVA